MPYLVHSSHSQMGALPVGCVGWALTLTALGVVQWRVWLVDDLTYATSGVAWVGVWRACFYSHALVSPQFRVMYCHSVTMWDDFAPPEVKAAQVLMLASSVLGLLGNSFAVYALRNVHLGLADGGKGVVPVRTAFSAAGVLLVLAAAASLTPLAWNVYAVANNQTIAFPPEAFHLPPAPRAQKVGAGIMVGIIASVMTLTSGVMYLNYRLPRRSGGRRQQLGVRAMAPASLSPQLDDGGGGWSGEQQPAAETSSGSGGDRTMNNNRRVTLVLSARDGVDNPGFETV